jgi:hypothetical protein
MCIEVSVHASDHWADFRIENVMALHFSTLCIFIVLSETFSVVLQWT